MLVYQRVNGFFWLYPKKIGYLHWLPGSSGLSTASDGDAIRVLKTRKGGWIGGIPGTILMVVESFITFLGDDPPTDQLAKCFVENWRRWHWDDIHSLKHPWCPGCFGQQSLSFMIFNPIMSQSPCQDPLIAITPVACILGYPGFWHSVS